MTTTTRLVTGSESMADRAYLVLRDRLIMMDIVPGEPINEGLLVEELGLDAPATRSPQTLGGRPLGKVVSTSRHLCYQGGHH